MALDRIGERREHVAKVLGERKGLTTREYKEIAGIFGCSVPTIVKDVRYILHKPSGCAIYGLRDPETNIIRYVGQTQVDAEHRCYVHIIRTKYGNENNAAKAQWIGDLLARGKEPTLVILEQCEFEQLNEREQWWIKHYANAGANLTNSRGYVARREKTSE